MHPHVRISASQTIIESEPSADARAAAEFAQRNALVLDDIFAPDVQGMLERLRGEAHFVPDEIAIGGRRLKEAPPRSGPLLCWLLNRPTLRQWLERITGIAPLASVGGATARFLAGGCEQLDWHNDIVDPRRMLAITVNLGSEPYQGGRFEMRRPKSDSLLLEFDHHRWGSALVFRIGKDLEHRVTPVTGGGPRTVFGGWFMSERLPRATAS